MPQVCTICRHSSRGEIDQLLIAGIPLRNIAKQFLTSATALHRHRKHIAKHIVEAKEAAQVADAGTLLDQVKQLLKDAQRLTRQAEQAKQLDVALRGIREVRGVIELLSKVSAELDAKQVPFIVPESREELERRIRELLETDCDKAETNRSGHDPGSLRKFKR